MKPGNIYRWKGTTNKPPILCLHGFLGSGADFEIVARHYPAHPDLIAPDFPDFANEAYPSEDPWGCAMEQLHHLVAHEAHNQPLILLGYSMGGRIALRYALQYPLTLKALVLVGATPGLRHETERAERNRADRKLADELLEEPLDAFLIKWFQRGLIHTQRRIAEPFLSRMQKTRHSHNKQTLAYYLTALGTGSMTPAWDQLQYLEVPTLLVTGDEDEKFTNIAQEMMSLLPRGHICSLRDAGHAACFEQPAAFTKALASFLAPVQN